MKKHVFSPDFPFKPARFPFYYGWVSLLVAVMGMLSSAPGQTIGFSVFTDSLMEASRLDRLTLCVAYFLGTMTSGFLIRGVGPFYDKRGGRFLMCLAAGGLGVTLVIFSGFGRFFDFLNDRGIPGFMWISLAGMSLGFLCIRFLGQGMLMLTSRNLIGKWFEADRGKVSALAGIAVAVGFSLVPAFFLWLIRQFGWENSYRYLALSLTGVFFLGWLFYRDNPEECGIRLDAYRPQDTEDSQKLRSQGEDLNLQKARLTLAFWVVCLCLSLHGLMMTAISFHITHIGELAGLDQLTVVGIFIPIAVVSGVADILSGLMADRFPLRFVISLMMAGCMLGFAGVISLESQTGYWLAVAGLGIANGCFGTLSTVAMPHYFGRKFLGETSGYLMFCLVVGSAFGPVYFALTGRVFGVYTPALTGASLTALAIFLLSFKIRSVRGQPDA